MARLSFAHVLFCSAQWIELSALKRALVCAWLTKTLRLLARTSIALTRLHAHACYGWLQHGWMRPWQVMVCNSPSTASRRFFN